MGLTGYDFDWLFFGMILGVSVIMGGCWVVLYNRRRTHTTRIKKSPVFKLGDEH